MRIPAPAYDWRGDLCFYGLALNNARAKAGGVIARMAARSSLRLGIPRRAFRIGISVCVAVMGRTLSKDGAFVYRPLGYIEPSPDISPLGMIVTEPPRLK